MKYIHYEEIYIFLKCHHTTVLLYHTCYDWNLDTKAASGDIALIMTYSG